MLSLEGKPLSINFCGRGEIGDTRKKYEYQKRKKSTTREFILVTLTHAERRLDTNRELVRDRLRALFECRAILVAKETHSEVGCKSVHAGVQNTTASKHTATRKRREVFKEREGRALGASAAPLIH